MRIKSLWISEYKNLKDFTIEFDTSNPLNIIIGANGSGKSNFLEALALIFKELYLLKESTYYDDKLFEKRVFNNKIHLFSSINFSYSLEMIDKEKDIIKIQYESNEAYVFYKNQVEFSLYDGLIFLPENILVNYSGNSNRIKNIVNRFLLEKNKLEKELSDLEDFDEYYEAFQKIRLSIGVKSITKEGLNKLTDFEDWTKTISLLGHAGPTIGFLSANIHVGASRALWRGVLDAAATGNTNLICFPGGRLHASEAFEAERNSLYDLVDPAYLDGLISWTSALAGIAPPDEIITFRPNMPAK